MLETKNYHLTTKEDLVEKMHLVENTAIPLKNALGEHNHLRNWIIPNLLHVLTDNQHHEYPQNLFEIGRTFTRNKKTETGIEEKEHLAITLCHEKVDFTEIRQILDTIFSALAVEYSVKETEHPSFIRGRVGEINSSGTELGFIGEIAPAVLATWGLLMPVVAIELDIEKLFEIVKRKEK